jgi:hypothetical protein
VTVRGCLGLDEWRPRLEQVLWVVDHVDDLDADFCAFYGTPDMMALPGVRWLRRAYRVFAYEGVMAARVKALQDEDGTTPVQVADGPLTATTVRVTPALADVISFG